MIVVNRDAAQLAVLFGALLELARDTDKIANLGVREIGAGLGALQGFDTAIDP